MHVKWKHFFQSFNHNVPFSKEAAMFCSVRAALCGPHHLGLGEADSMSFIQKKKHVILAHRSSLATTNMECFSTIPAGLVLLWLAIHRLLEGGGGQQGAPHL